MGDEFNPAEFFAQIRKSASVKAGAIMFGQAQIAYYDTLKEQMTDEEAFNLLAHTTEVLVRSLLAAAAPTLKVLLEAAALWEALGLKEPMGGKEVPGEQK